MHNPCFRANTKREACDRRSANGDSSNGLACDRLAISATTVNNIQKTGKGHKDILNITQTTVGSACDRHAVIWCDLTELSDTFNGFVHGCIYADFVNKVQQTLFCKTLGNIYQIFIPLHRTKRNTPEEISTLSLHCPIKFPPKVQKLQISKRPVALLLKEDILSERTEDDDEKQLFASRRFFTNIINHNSLLLGKNPWLSRNC